MALVKHLRERLELRPETSCGVSVVMQVHLHLAESLLTERRQAIEQLGPVLFRRIEKRVLRRAAVGIAELTGHGRVTLEPPFHAAQRNLWCRTAIHGLEVVGHGEQDVHDPVAAGTFAAGPRQRPEIPGQPEFRVSRQGNGHDATFQDPLRVTTVLRVSKMMYRSSDVEWFFM